VSKRWPEKLIVGLTGNIATGKSTILKLAEERLALTLDADSLVHGILANDPEVQQEIADGFGESVRGPDGAIDRAALAVIVFSDDAALHQLERILHPRVRQLLHRRIDRSAHDIVFIEAIKLLEGGLAEECDQIWVTRCPAETQVERLMTFREMDEETARLRVRAQSSQEIKVAAADVIIDTGGTMEMTKAIFELAWSRLQRQLASRGAPDYPHRSVADGIVDNGRVSRNRQEYPAVEADERRTAEIASVTNPRDFEQFGSGVSVRRAQPGDVTAMAALVAQATHGILDLSPADLLADFGRRGYLIGRQGESISAAGGWNAENLVATIDCLYVYPPEALGITGAAILQEIEVTANELICEVIIALPGDLSPAGTRQLLLERGFRRVDPGTLPPPWRSRIDDDLQPDATVMLKVLRDTRQVRIRTLKEHDG
jgi:dephospho-CoA kinase